MSYLKSEITQKMSINTEIDESHNFFSFENQNYAERTDN